MKKTLSKFFFWIGQNRVEAVCILLLILVAAFFRFYLLSERYYFISDAGRDAREIYEIVVDHRIKLVGPRASVAGFYLGPFYFYLMAIPLWISKFDPIGLAYFSAFIGVVAVGLVYLICRRMFGFGTAVVCSLLFATCPIVIEHTRMAWNPSPVPFFTLLFILFLLLFNETCKQKWLVLSWATIGLGIQLHYNFIFLALPLGIYLLIHRHSGEDPAKPETTPESVNFDKPKKHLPGDRPNLRGHGSWNGGGIGVVKFVSTIFCWHWAKKIVIGILITAGLNFTLIVFDVRHQFLTSKAFIDFLFGEKVGFNLSWVIGNYWRVIRELIDVLFFSGVYPTVKAILFVAVSVGLLIRNRDNKENRGNRFYPILLLIFYLSAFFLAFFKSTIQLYYYNFLFPLPFLILGCALYRFRSSKTMKVLAVVFVSVFFYFNFSRNINPGKPFRTLSQIKEITRSIVDKIDNKTHFNVAAFSVEPWYTAEEYRYFTYYYDKRAKGPEDYKNINKLFVISDKPMENPLSIKSQETVEFGGKKVESSWQTAGYWIYELVK